MSTMTLSEQVDRLVAENQHLRVKSDNDDKTIHLLKQQYDGLAAQVANIRDRAAADIASARQWAMDNVQDMEIERNKAQVAYREMESLLLQATDLVAQALRARVGDGTPEKMPAAILPNIDDPRLPAPQI